MEQGSQTPGNVESGGARSTPLSPQQRNTLEDWKGQHPNGSENWVGVVLNKKK